MDRSNLYLFDFKEDAKSIRCPNDACNSLLKVEDWIDSSVGCEDCGDHYAIECPVCGKRFDHILDGYAVEDANHNISRTN